MQAGNSLNFEETAYFYTFENKTDNLEISRLELKLPSPNGNCTTHTYVH